MEGLLRLVVDVVMVFVSMVHVSMVNVRLGDG